MKRFIESGFVVTLLFAAACSSRQSGSAGDQPGGRGDDGAGAAGGAGGTVTAGGLGGAAWLTPPALPPALAVPAGAMIEAHTHAVGSQIYTCTAGGDADAGATTYAWTLKAPDARLYDADGAQVGTHGAGPSWTSGDGSVANGVKVAQVDAPAAGAIPWLLLRVSSTSGAGVFSDVTFVQRLNTVGGVAPATGCDSTTAATDTPVGYSGDYYFYVGGAAGG